MSRPRGAFAPAATLAALLVLLLPSGASARNAYVADYGADAVSVIDGLTNQVVGPPISTGPDSGPFTLAIAPDGRTAYAVNYDAGSVTPIDTTTNQAGPPIPVPIGSYGIAITPDGTRAYVGDSSAGALTAIDLASRQVVGEPIPVCFAPSSVTITPDGARAYVACQVETRAVDLASGQVVGPSIATGTPYGAAVTPDGRTLFVADTSGLINVIDTATNQAAAAPIQAGDSPTLIAITPDGTRAYASDHGGNQIFVIDTATRQLIGPPIKGVEEPEYMAISPDGSKLFAAQYKIGGVVGLSLPANQSIGAIPTGAGASGLAFVPDQSPLASFSAPTRVRPRVATSLDGSASSDPDGAVATYAWQFGDGASTALGIPKAPHRFGRPGTYRATLTVTDDEGCSVAMVYTGQTAYCHGSPAASQTRTVRVAYPGVRVRCPKRGKAKSCRFKLKAVRRVGKGRKRRLRSQSAVASVKVKAGKSKVVSLKPKRKYAGRLARARKALVQQIRRIGGVTTTKVGKLKIVE